MTLSSYSEPDDSVNWPHNPHVPQSSCHPTAFVSEWFPEAGDLGPDGQATERALVRLFALAERIAVEPAEVSVRTKPVDGRMTIEASCRVDFRRALTRPDDLLWGTAQQLADVIPAAGELTFRLEADGVNRLIVGIPAPLWTTPVDRDILLGLSLARAYA